MNCKEILRNSSLSFWYDKWHKLGPLRNCIQGPLPLIEEELSVSQVVDHGRWNLSVLSFLFPSNLLDVLLATPLRFLSSREDILSWEGNSLGKFDTKSAYKLALKTEVQLPLFEGRWI